MQIRKNLRIKDIAKKAGVSPSTVSRVLNNNPTVKPEIQRRVEDVLKELNYQREKSNYFRKSKKTQIIGLIIPDLLNPWFPLMIKGIENVAKIHGYSIILCDSENDPEIEKKHIINLLDKRVEGLIFIPSPGYNDLIIDLVNQDFPLVFLDRIINCDDINCVTSANEEGAYQATKYLLSLGHKDIVYISGPKFISTEIDRFKGFQKAIEESSSKGIVLKEDLILQGEYNWDIANREVSKIIESGAKFTAIFASNDIMAFGAKQAIENVGLKIPDDISIIGFDDIPFSATISLTTISQQAFEMGKNAMLLSIDLIKKRITPPQKIILNTSIVIRSSCKKI